MRETYLAQFFRQKLRERPMTLMPVRFVDDHHAMRFGCRHNFLHGVQRLHAGSIQCCGPPRSHAGVVNLIRVCFDAQHGHKLCGKLRRNFVLCYLLFDD